MNALRGVNVLVVLGCMALCVCLGCSSAKVADIIDDDAQGADVSTLPADQQVFRYVTAGDTSALKSLFESNPDLVNIADEIELSTPLHVAASTGNSSMVDFLLDHGADPNARDINGESPADVARQQAHLGIASELQEIAKAQ